MFHGISIVVQGSTVRKSSDKPFLMPLSLVCDTKKMSMLDLNSKRVICPSMQGKHERICIDRYWSSLKKKDILFVDKIQKELVVIVV